MEGIFPYTIISSGFFTLGWKPLGAVTSQQSKYFQHIHGAALHLLGVINDILNLSKIKSEVVDLKESKVEILAVVDSTLRILKEHAENSGLELVNQVSPDLPKLWADERVVKQILLNLLSNPVKFTQPGGQRQSWGRGRSFGIHGNLDFGHRHWHDDRGYRQGNHNVRSG